MSKWRIWFALLAATVLVYGVSVRYGFSQDDFYFLSLSQAHSVIDVLRFFSPWAQHGFAFYRPLATQLYYYIFVSLFGLGGAPVPMHIFMILVQATNAYLVTELVRKLTRDGKLALFVGLLYATAAAHFISLFYIAATQELLAACFSLASLNAFLDKRYWRAGLWLIPALLSKETAIVTPAIAFLLTQYADGFRINVQKFLKSLAPYIVIALVYALLRFLAGVVVQSGYHPAFTTQVVATIRWYLFFAFSAPEILLNYAGPHLSVNFAQFIGDFGVPAGITTVATLVGSLTFLGVITASILKEKPFSRVQAVTLVIWWLVGIVLVMWYPDHRYPHYLDLALIPLLIAVVGGVGIKWRSIVVGILLVASLASTVISLASHWTVQRDAIVVRAEERIASVGACSHPVWDIVGIGDSPEQLSYALSLENGPEVICHNPSLRVYYQGMSLAPAGAFVISTWGLTAP